MHIFVVKSESLLSFHCDDTDNSCGLLYRLSWHMLSVSPEFVSPEATEFSSRVSRRQIIMILKFFIYVLSLLCQSL